MLGKTVEDIAALLAGAAGTDVELTVVSRGRAPRQATVTRQVLGQPSAKQEQARPTSTVSTASDASFVCVEGTWDDSLASLAAPEFATRAAERRAAAARAWDDVRGEPCGPDPRARDARLLHWFADWARDLGAGLVQLVPAGKMPKCRQLPPCHTHTQG